MRFSLLSVVFAIASASVAMSAPVLERGNTSVNPAAITGTTCTNKAQTLVSHDINVAVLSICGGIAGTIEKCGGNPTSTTGASGTAKFTLTPTVTGATLNVSKGRWEGCVRAAQALCGDTPFTTTCIGGASSGDIAVTLAHS